MTQHTVIRSKCPECERVSSRVQQLAQERDEFREAALEMGDELNRLRHFKAATLRLARDMPERSGLALEPKERDTWYQPDKRIRNDVPFVCGGEL